MTEIPSNPIAHKQIHPGAQFLILIGILLVALFAGSLIGLGIVSGMYGPGILNDILQLKLDAPNINNALWIVQFAGTTFPILITPIFFSYVIVRDPDDYMKHHFHFPWVLISIVLVTMFAAQPVIEFLGNINAKMVLPKSMKGLEQWMRESEDEAKKISDNMMQMKTFASMIFDLLFIGLLTAIVEEILFRGCMQTVFVRWTKNVHVAVWITAILFSAFHMEFYGFLPRLLLGLLFGYFTAWSGSVWPAIWGHFINNGTAVVLTYLFQNKIINIDPDEAQSFNTTGYIIGFVITVLLLFIYKYISDKWHNEHHGEELDQDIHVN